MENNPKPTAKKCYKVADVRATQIKKFIQLH